MHLLNFSIVQLKCKIGLPVYCSNNRRLVFLAYSQSTLKFKANLFLIVNNLHPELVLKTKFPLNVSGK